MARLKKTFWFCTAAQIHCLHRCIPSWKLGFYGEKGFCCCCFTRSSAMWNRSCKCCVLEQDTLSTLLSTGFYPGRKRATWKISTRLLNVLPSINKVDYYYYYHSLPSADSRREVVSYLRKNVHWVLVNRLIGLSLPRKSVVRLTDCPNMTLAVDRGR